jgi:hypothetical protein
MTGRSLPRTPPRRAEARTTNRRPVIFRVTKETLFLMYEVVIGTTHLPGECAEDRLRNLRPRCPITRRRQGYMRPPAQPPRTPEAFGGTRAKLFDIHRLLCVS